MPRLPDGEWHRSHSSPRRASRSPGRSRSPPARQLEDERARAPAADGSRAWSSNARRSPRPRSEHERRQCVRNVVVDRVGVLLVTSIVRKYCGEKEYGCPDRFEVLDVIERVTSYFGVEGCEAEPMHRALSAHKRGRLWPTDEEEARNFAIAMRDFLHEERVSSRSEHEARKEQIEAEQQREHAKRHRERKKQGRREGQQEQRSADPKRKHEQQELRERHSEPTSPSASPPNKSTPSHGQKARPPVPPRPSGARISEAPRPNRLNANRTPPWKTRLHPQPEPELEPEPAGDSAADTSSGMARQLALMRCATNRE